MKNSEKKEAPFLSHLEILRWHLVRASIAIVVCASVAFFYSRFIFDHILFAPRNPEFITNRLVCEVAKMTGISSICINSTPFQLINISMAGQFSTDIWVSIYAGLLVAFPFVFWEIWRFISPALYEKEQKYARGAVFFSSLLLFLGVLFGYFIILPFSVDFLGNYSVSNQVLNQINIESYISTVTSVILASGIAFELPIVIYFLSKIGLVNPPFLKKYRKHAVLVILIVAAIITPPDVFSQVMVTVPLLFLYEVSILISKRVVKNRDVELATI